MNSKVIAIKNLRSSLSNIADEVEFNGKSFEVFRRSKPSFKIVPITAEVSEWETVIDFTTKNGEGMNIDRALDVLQ